MCTVIYQYHWRKKCMSCIRLFVVALSNSMFCGYAHLSELESLWTMSTKIMYVSCNTWRTGARLARQREGDQTGPTARGPREYNPARRAWASSEARRKIWDRRREECPSSCVVDQSSCSIGCWARMNQWLWGYFGLLSLWFTSFVFLLDVSQFSRNLRRADFTALNERL